jgi:hypothetical protein
MLNAGSMFRNRGHHAPSRERQSSPVFRWIFIGAVALSLWWVVALLGIRLPRLLAGWPASVALLVACATLAHLSVWIARRVYPTFLSSPDDLGTGDGLLSIVLWCVPAYLVVAVALWTVAYQLVPRDDERRALIVYGLPIWGGLWLCLPPATFIAWWRARRSRRKHGSGRRDKS